jgi:hypothetical protein
MLLRADSHAMECLAKMLTWATDFVQNDAISGSSSSAVRYVHLTMGESILAKDYYIDHIRVIYREAI